MSTEKSPAVIQSALDVLELVNHLAQDFQPRFLKDLTATYEPRGWSQSKIFQMLATLIEAGWVIKVDSAYALSSTFAAIARNWDAYISRRAQELLSEVAQVQANCYTPSNLSDAQPDPNCYSSSNLPDAEAPEEDLKSFFDRLNNTPAGRRLLHSTFEECLTANYGPEAVH